MELTHTRYYWLCALSGLTWSGIAYLLLQEWFPGLWVGIALSPVFGLLVGVAHRPTYRLPAAVRVLVALATLYATAVLFGLIMGVVDAATETSPSVIKSAVVIEWVLLTLWGVTFTGYIVILWPLAFANHWLLGRPWKADWTKDSS